MALPKLMTERMLRIPLFVVAFVIANLLHGQYNNTLRSGRPGQAIGAYTLGLRVLQFQTGATFNRIKAEGMVKNRFSETTVLRIGVSEKIEMSSVIRYQSEQTPGNHSSGELRGLSDSQIGARVNILEADGPIPSLGLQGRILLKAPNREFPRKYFGSRFILASGTNLFPWLSLLTNFGVAWSGNDSGANAFYIINFSSGLSEKITGFVEFYGSFNDFTSHFDAGFSYLVNNDLLLDLSAGIQNTVGTMDGFIDFGLSWRWDWRELNNNQ